MLQNKHHKKKNSSTQFLFLGSKIFQDLASQPSAKDLPRPALRPRTSQSSSPRARARAHPSGEKQGLPLPVAGHHPTLDQTMNWSKKENGRHFWEVNLRINNSSEKGIMYIILYNMNNDSIYLVDSQIRSKSQARQMHPQGSPCKGPKGSSTPFPINFPASWTRGTSLYMYQDMDLSATHVPSPTARICEKTCCTP